MAGAPMIRRAFMRRMVAGALAASMLRSELLGRGPEVEEGAQPGWVVSEMTRGDHFTEFTLESLARAGQSFRFQTPRADLVAHLSVGDRVHAMGLERAMGPA